MATKFFNGCRSRRQLAQLKREKPVKHFGTKLISPPQFSFSRSYLCRRERRSGPRRARTAETGARVSAWLSSRVGDVCPSAPLLSNPGAAPEREDVFNWPGARRLVGGSRDIH